MQRTRRGGFTLVEILVVITIITILMALLVVMVRGVIERARIAKTRAFIETLHTQCENYKTDYGLYPPAQPQKESANLHLYLGRNRKKIESKSQDGSADVIIEKDAFMAFKKDMLDAGATNTYPDPPSELIDAWTRVLHYKNPGTHNKRGVDIWSDGPNDKTDEDDIGNWRDE